MKKYLISAVTAIMCLSQQAFGERVTHAVIQTVPPSSTFEFGLVFSNSGMVPAKLLLYCKEFVNEPDWDGTVPADAHPCGSVPLQVRLTSVGLSAYFVDYAQDNPLTLNLHISPEATPLRSVIGSYTGGKAGAGVVVEGRAMVLRNDQSGVWVTTSQAMAPKGDNPSGYGVGIDLSKETIEVYLQKKMDLNEHLGNLKGTGV